MLIIFWPSFKLTLLQRFGFFLGEDVLYNGIKFFYEEQYEIAAVFLENAYQGDSTNVVTLYYIALLKYEYKDYNTASRLFQEVVTYSLINYLII
jgi:hypothetical protein